MRARKRERFMRCREGKWKRGVLYWWFAFLSVAWFIGFAWWWWMCSSSVMNIFVRWCWVCLYICLGVFDVFVGLSYWWCVCDTDWASASASLCPEQTKRHHRAVHWPHCVYSNWPSPSTFTYITTPTATHLCMHLIHVHVHTLTNNLN